MKIFLLIFLFSCSPVKRIERSMGRIERLQKKITFIQYLQIMINRLPKYKIDTLPTGTIPFDTLRKATRVKDTVILNWQ